MASAIFTPTVLARHRTVSASALATLLVLSAVCASFLETTSLIPMIVLFEALLLLSLNLLRLTSKTERVGDALFEMFV